jgi:hypothetical protein
VLPEREKPAFRPRFPAQCLPLRETRNPDTEVGNAQPSVTAEKQIGWLDVTMDDEIAMH